MAAFYYQFWTMGERKFIDLPPTGGIYTSAVSMAFAAVVFSQVGCVFACRSDCDSFRKQNFFNNRLLWWGVVFEVVFLAVCVYVPSLQKVCCLVRTSRLIRATRSSAWHECPSTPASCCSWV